MSVDYCVEINRLVWGDYEPRLVGVAHSRDEHISMVEEDYKDRLGDAKRLWIYSFVVFEECDDARSRVYETVVYGNTDDSLRLSVEELWNNWIDWHAWCKGERKRWADAH